MLEQNQYGEPSVQQEFSEGITVNEHNKITKIPTTKYNELVDTLKQAEIVVEKLIKERLEDKKEIDSLKFQLEQAITPSETHELDGILQKFRDIDEI
jgi:CRISPR/Cas system CSM-associated protein Csm4 (group 5 of RAMP superfamily)